MRAVAQIYRSGGIRADQVAAHDIARGVRAVDADPVFGIAGNQVTRRTAESGRRRTAESGRRRSADSVAERLEDLDTVNRVAQRCVSGGVRADVIALNHVRI